MKRMKVREHSNNDINQGKCYMNRKQKDKGSFEKSNEKQKMV